MSKETKTVSWDEWARLTNKSITDIRLLDRCIDAAFKILVDTGIVEYRNGWYKRVKA